MNQDGNITITAMPKIATNHDGALSELARCITATAIATPLDEVLETRMKLAFMQEQIKELKARLDEKLAEWIEANGEIRFGSKRLYVGVKKDTKCRALRPAMEALLNACGGDWEQFCECMASSAIKYGAAKSVMGEEVWKEHFEVVEKTELKEGEPVKVKGLIEIDDNFLPRKRK